MPRPAPIRSAVTLGAAYFAAITATISTTRFEGGVAFIWIGTAVLTGYLACTPQRRWRPGLLVCLAASAMATGLFGFGWALAAPLALANVGEALVTAALLRRRGGGGAALESLEWLAGFVFAAGLAGPTAGALAGALAAHLITGAPFQTNLINWFTGHALGTLTFTPIAIMLWRGDVRRWSATAGARRATEAAVLLGLVTATSLAVFAQSLMPLLFLPLMPIMLATFRVGRLGAAISVVVLALVGGAFTLTGHGPISLMQGSLGGHLQLLQLYLASTVLTVLPVTADLAQRSRLVRELRDSEARYRVLADHSTDIILNLDVDGRIRFASPSVRQLGGYDPEQLVGRNSIELIAPEHVESVREAHLATLKAGGAPVSVEYLGITRAGERRWFETHARAIVDEGGDVDGVISIVRDIAGRKVLEAQLSEAALTDPLTGLPNRRAFMQELSRRITISGDGREGGCVALFDVDHFKAVNDTHGHAAGDRVLGTVAGVAKRMLRGGDVVARIGGEEFAVLLAGATVDQAELVCDRLRRAVSEATTAVDNVLIRVTVSGGIAALGGAEPESPLAAADAALYRAKAAGRNRLALAA